MSEIFQEVKESLTMQQVAEHFGYTINRSGFIFSPFGEEKTASCKLYHNSYYDFSTATGGDLIRFTAAILHINNWRACQYLAEVFSLPIFLSGMKEHRKEIEQQKREQYKRQQRKQEFQEAWLEEIEKLRTWEQVYQRAIDEKIYSPLSEMQKYVVLELQKISYKLDILCAADCETYRRMKPDKVNNLPSDRMQWLLDVLAILKEDRKFFATESEVSEIRAQRNFEWNREYGKDRVCNITW